MENCKYIPDLAFKCFLVSRYLESKMLITRKLHYIHIKTQQLETKITATCPCLHAGSQENMLWNLWPSCTSIIWRHAMANQSKAFVKLKARAWGKIWLTGVNHEATPMTYIHANLIHGGCVDRFWTRHLKNQQKKAFNFSAHSVNTFNIIYFACLFL